MNMMQLPFEIIGRSKKCFIVRTTSMTECFISVGNTYEIMSNPSTKWEVMERYNPHTGRCNKWIVVMKPKFF